MCFCEKVLKRLDYICAKILTVFVYLRVFRVANLALIALAQYLLRYNFLLPQKITPVLSDMQFALLVFATVCITLGGYVINDIQDVAADRINRKDQTLLVELFSENVLHGIYFAVNVIGVAIGFYLANSIDSPGFAGLFVLTAVVLYLYPQNFKTVPVLGNIVVAALCALALILVGLFDLYPALNDENRTTYSLLFQVILDYAGFCFFLTLIREWVKDQQDILGDEAIGRRTLAVALGTDKMNKVVSVTSILFAAYLVYYTFTYYFAFDLYFAAALMFALPASICAYVGIKIWNASSTNEYKLLSNLLKIAFLGGVLLIAVVTYNVKMNVQ